MVLKYQQQGIPLCGLESMPPPEGPYVKHFYETCTRVETREGNVVWRMRDKEFQTEEECQKYEKDILEKEKQEEIEKFKKIPCDFEIPLEAEEKGVETKKIIELLIQIIKTLLNLK
jgi:hypothetical protein